MKRTSMFALALGLAPIAAIAQNPNFTHLSSIDLSANFSSTSSLGDTVADVAFDGTNAYVVGFDNAVASGSVGVLKVSNVLGSYSTSTLLTVSGQAGSGRDSKILYDGGALYVGTGLGDQSGSGTSGASKIGKYDTAGNLDGTFGNLLPGNVASSSLFRVDALDKDPLAGGSLGMVSYSHGFNYRRNLTTSADNGNAQFSVTGDSGNQWRDISYDASGNAYLRAQNNVYFATRGSVSGSTAYTGLTKIVNLGGSVNLAQENILFAAGSGFSDLIFYNDRTAGLHGVNYANTAGGLQGSLTGAEAIGGVNQTAWTGNLLNFQYATVGSNHYLLVADGNSNRLDIYSVEAVPEPMTMFALGAGALALIRRRKQA